MASYDYSKQLNNLRTAQKKAQTAELQNVRNQALSNLNAEAQQNTANYATQRSTANAQNRLSARNFQEYLANTGRANSGLGAQAAMQYNNNLNTSLNNIYGAENAANADILRRRTDAQNAYNTGLAAANANIEANYIQALMDQKAKAWERAMQEKEYKESVRQFNENLKLQKQQLQQRFSSGSGGGSYSYRGGNNGNNEGFTDTQDKNKQKNDTKNKKSNEKHSKSNPYKSFSFSINDKNMRSNVNTKKNNKTKKGKSSGLSNFYSLKPNNNTKLKVALTKEKK